MRLGFTIALVRPHLRSRIRVRRPRRRRRRCSAWLRHYTRGRRIRPRPRPPIELPLLHAICRWLRRCACGRSNADLHRRTPVPVPILQRQRRQRRPLARIERPERRRRGRHRLPRPEFPTILHHLLEITHLTAVCAGRRARSIFLVWVRGLAQKCYPFVVGEANFVSLFKALQPLR